MSAKPKLFAAILAMALLLSACSSPKPTPTNTPAPAVQPTAEPATATPAPEPTKQPEQPTEAPTKQPEQPTEAPTKQPEQPTEAPTKQPEQPTEAPTKQPEQPTEQSTPKPEQNDAVAKPDKWTRVMDNGYEFDAPESWEVKYGVEDDEVRVIDTNAPQGVDAHFGLLITAYDGEAFELTEEEYTEGLRAELADFSVKEFAKEDVGGNETLLLTYTYSRDGRVYRTRSFVANSGDYCYAQTYVAPEDLFDAYWSAAFEHINGSFVYTERLNNEAEHLSVYDNFGVHFTCPEEWDIAMYNEEKRFTLTSASYPDIFVVYQAYDLAQAPSEMSDEKIIEFYAEGGMQSFALISKETGTISELDATFVNFQHRLGQEGFWARAALCKGPEYLCELRVTVSAEDQLPAATEVLTTLLESYSVLSND